jgi:hypothetical protein
MSKRRSKYAPSPEKLLHTSYGDFNLAKPADRKRMQGIIAGLQMTTDALTRKDIADWRKSWQMAINVDNPNRQRLYDIYRDVEIDAHLSGCVEQRKGFVLARSFKLIDASGEINKDASHYFDQEWFKQLLKLCLDATYWGHSLIELGDIITNGDGCPCYECVRLVPRKHVIPEFHRCIANVGDDWHSGIDYHAHPFSDWLIEAGEPYALGLYLKAAPHTIPKKNAASFWDTFAEIFGIPMRVAKTTTRDEKEWRRLRDMMQDAGSMLSMITTGETDIQFVETSKSDAYNVYNQRIDRANSEISKLIIGQTMTIEDGSSLSQSQTHLQVFENLVEADRDMLRDIINNQLIPRMVAHGFPINGLRFEWDDAIDYTPEQQLAYETAIADRYEVDGKYFADKYSMPVGERRSAMPFPADTSDSNDNDDTSADNKEDNKEDNKDDGNADNGNKKDPIANNAHNFFD